MSSSKKTKIAALRERISGVFPYGDKASEKTIYFVIRIIFEEGFKAGALRARDEQYLDRFALTKAQIQKLLNGWKL